jgi:DNA-directed RNA polymerase subunit beta'
MGLLLSRLGINYDYTEEYVKAYPYDVGLVPEDNKLVPRNEARKSNVYRRLPYTWSEVVSVEKVEREEVTYDFTVPEFPLFIGNNILVYDTMQVHVPVSEEARLEALEKMLPSKNLFSPRTGDPLMLPQQESVFGMYECSRPSKKKAINVTDMKKLRDDIEHDMIKPNDPVVVHGHTTTAGLALVNDVIPEQFRVYSGEWNKRVIAQVLGKIGKSTPGIYTSVADEIKELGALYSYKMGSSFKASDFDLVELKKARDANFAVVDKKIAEIDKSRMSDADKYNHKVELLRGAQAFNQKLTAGAKDNAFNQWAYTGSKGSESQVMQIIASPTIVADPRDRVIPIAIKKSYNEGLSPAEYWVSSYGTRKGTVGAKLSVAPGGALAKEVVGNVLDVVVTEHDCGTKEGIVYPIDDSHIKDLLDRYEVGTNRLVTDKTIDAYVKAGKKSINVRTPMKCRAQHGVCQLCHGQNEKGDMPEIGYNVGVVAAMAVTEPLTQMGLSSKHTAGTAAAEKVGLGTIKQFFTMPNTFSGAALAVQNSGTISRIEPGVAGGTDIYVDRRKYHAAPGRTVKVHVGDVVSAGDIVTDGIPNLSKIVPHKGIDIGRETFVAASHDLYRRAGAPSIRKNFETIARGLINYVKIDDPGDFDVVEGDVVDYNHLKAEISKHPEKHPPKFTPFQKGTTYSPQYKPDWLANFGFKYLKQNLVENAATGSTSELHQYHPIPGYAAAADFGKGQNGRY